MRIGPIYITRNGTKLELGIPVNIGHGKEQHWEFEHDFPYAIDAEVYLQHYARVLRKAVEGMREEGYAEGYDEAIRKRERDYRKQLRRKAKKGKP